MSKPVTYPLNIYRLTDCDGESFDPFVIIEGVCQSEIEIPKINKAKIFFKEKKDISPKWKKLAKQYLSNSEGVADKFNQLGNSIAGMLIILEMSNEEGNAIYAVSYGSGHHILNNTYIEERFGIKCALNSAKSSKIKSIDYKSFSRNQLTHRIQAGNSTDILECGINSNGDFLSAITCDIDEGYNLGKKITGKDKLGLTLKYDFSDFYDLLSQIEKIYKSDSYKAHYPWVDNLKEVKNKTKIKHLTKSLLEVIGKKNVDSDNISLVLPDIIDYEKIITFKYNINRTSEFPDIVLSDYFKLKNENTITLEDIKKDEIIACDDSGNAVDRWKIWKCLYCELDDNMAKFIFSHGKWFEVEKEFVNALNEDIENIPDCLLKFSNWESTHRTESEYNTFICEQNPWFFADKKLIQHGGSHSKIELCDIISDQQHLIHVKKYSGSAILSHLFSQGLISAELLKTDVTFCDKVKESFPNDSLSLNQYGTVDSSKYEIVFAIVTKSKKTAAELPLFGKLVLRHVYKSLIGLGYKVSLSFPAIKA